MQPAAAAFDVLGIPSGGLSVKQTATGATGSFSPHFSYA